MRGLFKTLFGSVRTILVGVGAVGLGVALAHGPAPVLAGMAAPVLLLAGAGYLARH